MVRFQNIWCCFVIVMGTLFVPDIAILFAQKNDASDPEKTNLSNSVNGDDSATKVKLDSQSSEKTVTERAYPVLSVEIERRFNELEREYLDDRADYIDMWLAVIAIVLTFFGIVIAIAGFIGYKRFRELETEAKKSVEEANNLVEEIKEYRKQSEAYLQDMLSEDIDDPDKAPEVEAAIRDVQSDPEPSLIDKVRAEIYTLQSDDKFEEAIAKWRSIANIAEGHDNELAAQAWLSIRYLSPEEEDRRAAFDKAMDLDPDYTLDYMKRRETKYSNQSRHGIVVGAVLHYFNDPKFRNFSTTIEYRIETGRYIADIVLHDEEGRLTVIVECKVNENMPVSTLAMLRRVFRNSDVPFGLLAAGTDLSKWTFFKILGREVTEISRSEFENGLVGLVPLNLS